MFKAFKTGIAVLASDYPRIPHVAVRRLNMRQHSRLAELKARRDKAAGSLGLDPTVIASKAMLSDLAYDWDQNRTRLMQWQLSLLQGNLS